jgi:hypothetical protein
MTIVSIDGPAGCTGGRYPAVSTVCDTPPPIRFHVNRGSAVTSVIAAGVGLSVNRLTAGRPGGRTTRPLALSMNSSSSVDDDSIVTVAMMRA